MKVFIKLVGTDSQQALNTLHQFPKNSCLLCFIPLRTAGFIGQKWWKMEIGGTAASLGAAKPFSIS